MLSYASELMGFSTLLELLEIKTGHKKNMRIIVPLKDSQKMKMFMEGLGLKTEFSDFVLKRFFSKANSESLFHEHYMRTAKKESAFPDDKIILYASIDNPGLLKMNELNHYALGKLLGYPECCIKNFVDNETPNVGSSSGRLIQTAELYGDARTISSVPLTLKRLHSNAKIKALPFYFNLLSQDSGLRILSHIPCSFECEESHKIAKRRIGIIDSIDPLYSAEISGLLRREAVFEGKRFHFY